MNIKQKNIILYVGNTSILMLDSVNELEAYAGKKYKRYLITSLNKKIIPEVEKRLDKIIRCNINEINLVEKAIYKFRDQVAVCISKYEFAMPLWARIVPFFTYLRNPDPRSILIANDKLEMRKTFRRYCPEITPEFIRVKKVNEAVIKKIIHEVGFPCVIKPTNLSKSKLVINCYYREELEKNLKSVFKKIKSLYKQDSAETEPKIIVEQLMEGQMYSIDAYVSGSGKIYYTPIIEIKTGKDAGYDDFFMYTQITPSVIDKKGEVEAQQVVEKAIYAIGLRSCTVHCELIKTVNGWKVIEIAPRTGGFREELLYNSFGIRHNLNDLLIHLGNQPELIKRKKRHTVFIKFWPYQAGKLVKLTGIKKAKEFKNLVKIRQNKKVGDYAGLSKDGHSFIVGFTLSAKTRSELLGDIRKLEKGIIIETKRKNGKKLTTKK